jgi:hypothetical protein
MLINFALDWLRGTKKWLRVALEKPSGREKGELHFSNP